MSARLARNTLTSAVRRAQTTASSSAARVSRRTMASSSHGAAKKSDTPWIAGSALIFGPAFLYLVSPSARKNSHHVHDDKHDFPALMDDEHSKARGEKKTADAPKGEPEIMKDDEGKEADVSSSVALSESSDVPNDAQSSGTHAALKSSAEADGSKEPEPEAKDESKGTNDETGGKDKKGTFQKGEEEGPTNMGKARDAAQEGTPPKKVAEKKD